MSKGYWIGIEEAMVTLDKLPTSVKRQNIGGAAAKSLLPVKRKAKSIITPFVKNTRDVSRAMWLRRAVKVVRTKGRNFGAMVLFKGPKIPGLKWDYLWKYARLFAFGAKGKRYTRGRNKANRGMFSGFVDPIALAGYSLDSQVRRTFTKHLFKLMDRAIEKARK